MKDARTIHGKRKSYHFNIWNHIKRRCYREEEKSYSDYGGRGIKVCDRWLEGEGGKHPLECFIEDMGDRPTASHSVERIDNDGDYEPGNCRWATPKEQARNRRSSRIISVYGDDMTVAEASEKYGVDYGLLISRIRVGWDAERAIETKPRRTGR